MFVGFTRYCSSPRVSFHVRPKGARVHGNSIDWKRVIFDNKPIEQIDLNRLRALVTDFDEYKPGSGSAVPFGHDTDLHRNDIEYIRLYLQYMIAAISDPLKESEMEDEVNSMRKCVLDNITRRSCHIPLK